MYGPTDRDYRSEGPADRDRPTELKIFSVATPTLNSCLYGTVLYVALARENEREGDGGASWHSPYRYVGPKQVTYVVCRLKAT